MVVVDSSAIVDSLVDPVAHPQIGEILQADAAALNAPHLIDLEVLSAFREMVHDRRLNIERASAFLHDFEDM